MALAVVLAACASAGDRPTGEPSGTAATGVSSSAALTPDGSPASSGPVEGELAIGPDVWAEVVVDGLNLRMRPGTSQESYGRLPAGSVGLVAGGPVEADGYTWFALAAPNLPYGTGCMAPPDPSILVCPDWFGWVASADESGEPFIVGRTLECPPVPSTLEELLHIQPGVRLACFGGAPLAFDAFVGHHGVGVCEPAFTIAPAWFDFCSFQYLATEFGPDGPGLAAHLHPDVGACDIAQYTPAETCPYAGLGGSVVRVEGRFDDPAAATCEASEGPFFFEGTELPDPAWVVYQCRERFVVTDISEP